MDESGRNRGKSAFGRTPVLDRRIDGDSPKNVTVSWYQMACVLRRKTVTLTMQPGRPA